MTYRDVLNAVHALERMRPDTYECPECGTNGILAGEYCPNRCDLLRAKPAVETPKCPDHPESCVSWSNLREAYRCVTCRKVLGNPDPSHVGANEVI